jgi:hypothetical protein
VKRLVDVDVIIKATCSTDHDRELLKPMLDFYNNHFPRIGIDLYMEETLDGMLMFYSTFEDFFSSFYVPNQCSPLSEEQGSKLRQASKGTPVRWNIQAEKLPVGHTFQELMRTAAKFYEKFIPGTSLVVMSDQQAILTFPNEEAFTYGLQFIQTCMGSANATVTSN